MENQINVGGQNDQQVGQNPFNQPAQYQEKPKLNYLMIGLIVLFCFLIFGLGGYYLGTQTQNKPSSSDSILPTRTVTSPTLTPAPPTNTPTLQPTTIKSVLQSITLKVAAFGGGATGERYDYAFTFNTEPQDEIIVLKRDSTEINQLKNFPNYNQDAVDKGLVIKHGTIDLNIVPLFECAGSYPLKKKGTVKILNTILADKPIYRINGSDAFIPQNASYTGEKGSHYTLVYSEKSEDCTEVFSLDKSVVACEFCSGVTLRDGHHLSISCSAEDDRANWCDNVVKSLSVSVTKYSN